MPTEIFAFIQSQAQTQALPQINSSVPSEEQDIQPGLFDSLITQFTAQEEATVEPEAVMLTIEPDITQDIAFSNNNSFSRTIIDMLAGEAQPEPLTPEIQLAMPEEDDVVIWPEDAESEPANPVDIADEPVEKEAPVISRVKQFLTDNPEATLEEVEAFILILSDEEAVLPEDFFVSDSEILSYNKEVDDEDDVPAKLMKVIADHFTVPKSAKTEQPETPPSVSDSDDTEDPDMPETPDSLPAGLVIVPTPTPSAPAPTPNPEPELQQAVSESTEHLRQALTTSHQPRQTRNVQHDEPAQTPETPDAPDTDTERATATFREALEERTTQHEDSNSHHQDGGQNFGQPHGEPRTNGRSRNDSRRVDSRPQNDRTNTSAPATTHRTESRSTFQTFFEGVLTSRRTASSPAPLSLRGTYSITQAQTLRTGLVNVVRFIRADGVQKANVVIDPPALGRISVELTSGTSGVEASIKVASEQVRQLVQNQLSELRMNLSQQGVQVTEFTVDVQQDNSGHQNPQEQDRQSGRVNFIGEAEDDDVEEFRVDLEEGLLYWVA